MYSRLCPDHGCSLKSVLLLPIVPVATNVIAVASRYAHSVLLSLLLNKSEHEFIVTEDIVKSVVINDSCAKEILLLLLNKRGNEFTITEDIVQATVTNEGNNFIGSLQFGKDDDVLATVTLLFDQRGHEFMITKDIFKKAIWHSMTRVGIVTLLLDRRGYEFIIINDIFKTAVRNENGMQ